MPLLGTGSAATNVNGEGLSVFKCALENGYRLIDSTTKFNTEAAVGQAIRGSGIPRDQVFVTTKLWTTPQREDRVYEAFEESLQNLGMDYVDLYLIHWPVPTKYTKAWRVLERIYKEGRARAIGVSNCNIRILENILSISAVQPTVNQCECHPRFANRQLREFCARNDIAFQGYEPLGQGIYMGNPTMTDIAAKHNKSVVQVLIRWQLQQGILCIPKSMKPDHIKANTDVFNFALDEEDLGKIAALDVHKSIGDFTPDCFDM
jgi:Aldo/keto reductases, related to diketogulonate reductase